jgi:hypothetical protein
VVQKKLSAGQARRVDEIAAFQRTAAKVRSLLGELESSRAAKTSIIQGLCSHIARELSQMRQRALTANIGTVGDTAGAVAVMATRSGGLNMKLRGIADGLNSIDIQLDQSLKSALAPEKSTDAAPETPKDQASA